MNRREFLAIAGAALARAAPNSPGGLQFFAARHDAGSDEITFDTPVEIDWEKLAREHAAWAFSEPLSPEVLQQVRQHACESCGSSEVPFSAPLDPRIGSGLYYLISPDGIGQLTPMRMAGFIRFPLDAAAEAGRPSALGQIAAVCSPRLSPPEGGFVLAAGAPVRFERSLRAKLAVRPGGDRVQLVLEDGAAPPLRVVIPFAGYSEVESHFTFQANAERFCFVCWQPDQSCEHGCCQWQYTLFEATRSLRLIAASQYDCDP